MIKTWASCNSLPKLHQKQPFHGLPMDTSLWKPHPEDVVELIQLLFLYVFAHGDPSLLTLQWRMENSSPESSIITWNPSPHNGFLSPSSNLVQCNAIHEGSPRLRDLLWLWKSLWVGGMHLCQELMRLWRTGLLKVLLPLNKLKATTRKIF